MIEFAIVLAILFLVSLLTFESENTFRKEKLPALKVFMAIVIILGHLSFRTPLQSIQPFRFWGAPFVSMFLFISGYGMWKSYERYCSISLGSILRRIGKLLVPYLITVALYYLLVRLPAHDIVIDLREIIVTGTSRQSHLWFVFAIFFLYLVFFVCTRLKDKNGIVLTMFIIVTITVLMLRMIGYDRCWYVSLMAFPTGCFCSMMRERIDEIVFKNRLWYSFAVLSAVICVGLTYMLGKELAFCVSHMFIPVAITLVIIQLPYERFNNRVTTHLGSISYELYLCQLVVMDSIAFLLPGISSQLYVVLVLAGSFIIAELVKAISQVCFKIIPGNL